MSMTDSPGTTSGQGTTDVAREQAREVGSSATQAAGQVAQTSKEQATQVAQEAQRQARDLASEVRTQVTDQANTQTNRLAGTIRTLGQELEQIGSGSGGQSGLVTDLASQFSSRVQDIAGYLENRQPGEIVEELRSFARQRPGSFLIGAAFAGVLAGRMTKGAVAAQQSSDSGTTSAWSGSTTEGALPIPSTTTTATNADAYATTTTYGSDPTIDLTGSAAGTSAGAYGSTHGTSAEGYREPTTGPLASDDSDYQEPGQSSRPQGWSS